MPQSWYEDRVRELLSGLKALEQTDEEAESARREAEAKLEKLTAGTRLKDRHLWLLVWANGDRTVYDRIKPLRDEIRLRKQQTSDIPRKHRTMLAELDDIITDDLGQNDAEFQVVLGDQREFRGKRDMCRSALAAISATREDITRMSSALPAEPKGKELTAARKRLGEISAQVGVVYHRVGEVNEIERAYGSINGALVKKLKMAPVSGKYRYEQRKEELDALLRTLTEVSRKVTAISDKIEKRLGELDHRRAQLVKAKRDRLLSTNGLKAT
jgi:chromosome segregation ATPase